VQPQATSAGPSSSALLACALALLCAVAASLLAKRSLELKLPAPIGYSDRALPPSTESIRAQPGGPTLAQALEPVLAAAALPTTARYYPSAKDVLQPFSDALPPGDEVPLPQGRALLEVVLLLTLEFQDDQVQVVHALQAHELHSGPEPDGKPEARLVFADEGGVQRATDAEICGIAPALLLSLEERVAKFPGQREGERRTLAHTLRLYIPDLKPRR
jgi:hypothetical protein